jgi:cysteine desulfurase/selenocysteine lyase
MTGAVYLDYAATAAVRPSAVAEAMVDYLTRIGATPGRAGHARALDAGRVALRCRRALAELLNLPGDPGRLVFQLNATHALNTALLGVLRPGDRVVRTRYDHNAVRRPLAALAGVEEVVLSGRPDGGIDLDELDHLLTGGRHPARLLVFPHASNVLGALLPAAEMAARARAAGALVLLDAAQTVGHVPVDVQRLGVDLVAFAGHKGLLGPQGTGALWVREGVEVAPLLRGGTGADSLAPNMPDAYPDHLEAGTQNGPGIAGLLAGVQWLVERGVGGLHRRACDLKAELHRRLSTIPGVRVHSPPAPDGLGILTLTSERYPAAELARRLEREHQILSRAGLHCAPEAHAVLGTLNTGAVRLSLGWATTRSDVERAAHALARLHDFKGEDGAWHA